MLSQFADAYSIFLNLIQKLSDISLFIKIKKVRLIG